MSQWVQALAARFAGFGIDLAITACFTGTMILWSFHHYRLFLYPMFDDNMYLWKSLEYVDFLHEHGWIALVRHYAVVPAHGPLTNLIGIAGFLMFGRHTWAPYIICGLLVLAFLRIARSLMPDVPAFWRLCMVTTLMSAPIIAYLVIEFRPDQFWGLILATTLISIITSPLSTAGRNRFLLIGTLFGIAMIAKTSTYPSTVAYCGLAACLRLGCDRWVLKNPMTLGTMARGVGWVLLPALLIAGPHYYVYWGGINYYIRLTLTGPNAGSWSYPGFWTNFNYYLGLKQGGGLIALGNAFWIFCGLACILVLLTQMISTRLETRAASLLLIILLVVTWALPTAMSTKNQYLGSAFHFMLLLCIAWHFNVLFRDNPNKQLACRLLGSMALLTAIATWSTRQMPVLLVGYDAAGQPDSYSTQRNKAMADLLAILRPQWQKKPDLSIMMPLSGNIISQTTLAYLALELDHAHIKTHEESLGSDEQAAQNMLQNMRSSDIIITCDPNNGEIYSSHENVTRLGRDLAAIQPWLKPVGDSHAHGNAWFHVYQNADAGELMQMFGGYDNATGLEPDARGPYPELNLPALHRSSGAQTVLQFRRSDAGPMAISLSGYAVEPNMHVAVLINGKPAMEWTFKAEGNFEDHHLVVDAIAGLNELTITYSTHRQLPDDQSAVHWRTILLSRLVPILTTQPSGQPLAN